MSRTSKTQIYDHRLERFVAEYEGMTGDADRYSFITGRPEVVIVHLVTETEHDIVFVVNERVLLKENHLDDIYHHYAPCVSNLAVSLSRALGTYVESLRLNRSDYEAAGNPQGKGLVDLARRQVRTHRPFASEAMVHSSFDQKTHTAPVEEREGEFWCAECPGQRTAANAV